VGRAQHPAALGPVPDVIDDPEIVLIGASRVRASDAWLRPAAMRTAASWRGRRLERRRSRVRRAS